MNVEYTCRFESLKEPARLRRAALEESQKWHKLSFDVDCEMQWIAEKVPIAASEDSGRSLTEATNMQKKHEQLEVIVISTLVLNNLSCHMLDIVPFKSFYRGSFSRHTCVYFQFMERGSGSRREEGEAYDNMELDDITRKA